MEKRNLKEEDIERTVAFLSRKMTLEEREEFLEFLNEDPKRKKEFFEIKDLWDSGSFFYSSHRPIIEKEWDRLHGRLSKEKQRPFVMPAWLRLTAFLILTFGLGWLGKGVIMKEGGRHTIEVPHGATSKITMAEGSEVWINSGSKLGFSEDFLHTRQVDLEGEAFFDVKKKDGRLFRVKAGNQIVEVLGTAFNVKYYPGDSCMEATLERGRIRLVSGSNQVEIFPGQQVQVALNTGEIKVKEVETTYYTCWKSGKIEFFNSRFTELIPVLERWYDVSVEYDMCVFEDVLVSGVFRREDRVEDVLEVLRQIIPFTYSIKEKKIQIKRASRSQILKT